MVLSPRTHYQVLAVRADANRAEIRRAYLELARLHHPDRTGSGGVGASASPGGSAASAERIREINQAWSVLRDPARRARYDDELALARSAAVPSRSGAPASGARPSDAPSRPMRSPGPMRVADEWELVDVAPGLGPAGYHLLRAGPIVLILAILALIFIVTANAGGPDDGSSPAPTTTTIPGYCVVRGSGRLATVTDCSQTSALVVVAEADEALDCPTLTTALVVDTDFVCARRIESGAPLPDETTHSTVSAGDPAMNGS